MVGWKEGERKDYLDIHLPKLFSASGVSSHISEIQVLGKRPRSAKISLKWPYSFRRGGATHWFSKHGSLDRIIVMGRWQAQRTARVYLNEGLSVLAEMAIPKSKLKPYLTLFRAGVEKPRFTWALSKGGTWKGVVLSCLGSSFQPEFRFPPGVVVWREGPGGLNLCDGYHFSFLVWWKDLWCWTSTSEEWICFLLPCEKGCPGSGFFHLSWWKEKIIGVSNLNFLLTTYCITQKEI